MRYRIVTLILCVVILLTLVGCGKSYEVLSDSVKDTVQPQDAPPLESLIMTKVNQFSYDLDADGAKETITLYSDVEVNRDGEYMWDDGQRWLLLVQDGKKYYPLISQYVQLGQVYYTVSYQGEEKLPSVTAYILTNNNETIYRFTSNPSNKVFIKERIYDSGNLNTFFSSVPSY